MGEMIYNELMIAFGEPDAFVRMFIRITAALLLGSAIGLEREHARKAAGLRTHLLVTLGTSVFVLGGVGYGMASDALSRVIQGIVTGIGFIGAGSIIKREEETGGVSGVTTSASVWMSAAIGIACGLGQLGLAFFATFLSVVVLRVLLYFDHPKPRSTASGDQSTATANGEKKD